MNRLNAIDNALNNTTCPKMIDSLIYERKAIETNFKATMEQLRQEELKKELREETLLERLRRLIK